MNATSCAVVIGTIFIIGCSGRSSPAETQGGAAADMNRDKAGSLSGQCKDLPDAAAFKGWLDRAPTEGGEAGGLFAGHSEWVAVVNRRGEICSEVSSTSDPAAVWPGSKAIAKAKAFTANAFSTDTDALSTARLYTLTQPGHSLWGAGNGNPFNPACLKAPDDNVAAGTLCGGSIVFGGGLPLYRGKTRVGGIGVSGDTACTDHEIAKRIRHLAQLNPEKGQFADDIVFTSADGPSPFAHPLCLNTWRNGQKIGDEANASGY